MPGADLYKKRGRLTTRENGLFYEIFLYPYTRRVFV